MYGFNKKVNGKRVLNLKIRVLSSTTTSSSANDWYVLTSPDIKGLYLADPNLNKVLSRVTSALKLLNRAEKERL